MQRHSTRAPVPGKRIALLTCMLVWHAAVVAADVLPAHLTGTWGAAESLYEGDEGQLQMHLDSDGFGVMTGSAPRPIRIDGKDEGGPEVRAPIGFALRATLTARVVALDPTDAEKARRVETTAATKRQARH